MAEAQSNMGENPHVCAYLRCGKAFETPVRLTDLSHKPSSETYYACPHCFSKVDNAEIVRSSSISSELEHLHDGGYGLTAGVGGSKKAGDVAQKELSKESTLNCPHHVGYLKTRPKNEVVPDGCFLCPKILQCMA